MMLHRKRRLVNKLVNEDQQNGPRRRVAYEDGHTLHHANEYDVCSPPKMKTTRFGICKNCQSRAPSNLCFLGRDENAVCNIWQVVEHYANNNGKLSGWVYCSTTSR